ncbi:MAG: YidC/Oxa1 family rane protein insertase [Blastocatellia bacterium]|nr:YidC/Oxa1 family rane protein insertase [Blastocatellia bacterium]
MRLFVGESFRLNQMQSQRFLLAIVISALILLGWSYLQHRYFPTPNPPEANANSSATPPQAAGSTLPNASPQDQPSPQTQANASTPDTTPRRTISVSTPLYDVKLDSRGAVVKSWILKKNKANNHPLYSVAGDRNHHEPLELISQEGIKQDKAPLQLSTGNDAGADTILNSRNYHVNGVEGDNGDVTLNLGPAETKSVEFTLHDDASGLDVTKHVTFNADNYDAQVEVKLARNNQPVPQATLLVGPSIGDQGISHYTFYSVAPEGVTVTDNEDVHRLLSAAVHKAEEGWLIFSSTRPEGADRKIVPGNVSWAGVGDTYFGMVAVPSKPAQGLEYRTTPYQHEANGKKEERYLITAYVPVPADGSSTQLYVGPKDHNILASASHEISQAVGGRKVNLEELINYGWLLGSVRRFLAVPILWSINELQKLTNSYGVAIILFTVFIYSLFFPLKWRSSKAMKKAQKLAPRMKELQEKIKGMKQNDPRLKDLQMEQLRLMKEGNPLGGCLPLLVQMPFLFALYSAITISLDFRQAAFLWMPDLSAGDPLHLLEILMAGSMIVLQLITPAPSADPLQRKMMAIGMPLFMLYILWGAPAGLLVYWLVGNIVGFSQQFLINHLTKSEDDEEPPGEKKSQTRSPKKLSPARVSQT